MRKVKENTDWNKLRKARRRSNKKCLKEGSHEEKIINEEKCMINPNLRSASMRTDFGNEKKYDLIWAVSYGAKRFMLLLFFLFFIIIEIYFTKCSLNQVTFQWLLTNLGVEKYTMRFRSTFKKSVEQKRIYIFRLNLIFFHPILFFM